MRIRMTRLLRELKSAPRIAETTLWSTHARYVPVLRRDYAAEAVERARGR